jgi:geranylgeranyl diphosphate synthase type I
VLFQIQDDVLDLYAEKGRERVGTDIAEGKISILVAHALAEAPDADAAWLAEVLARSREEVRDADIVRASELLREVGSLDYALAEIDRRRAAAHAELAAVPDALASMVSGLADVMLAPIRDVL